VYTDSIKGLSNVQLSKDLGTANTSKRLVD
jgi:hypothetical protein